MGPGGASPPSRGGRSSTVPVTRYAPSPTGFLHLGHVAHMLYVWGLADLMGGAVLVRMEDHDRRRCRAEFENALLGDMEWLGFEPANPCRPLEPTYRQSDCDLVYAGAIRDLDDSGLLYRCTCTRRESAAHAIQAGGEPRTCPGRCREVVRPDSCDHGLRLAWPAGTPPEEFTDGLLGWQCQRPERQCGDLLVRDRLGQWTYQFAVTVDDWRHGVDFVVRGADLLESTGRQLRLARALGWNGPARYFHHPLVRDVSGVKLSKRQKIPGIRDLRLAGAAPEMVLGEAARAVGLHPRAKRIAPGDAAGLVAARHGPLGCPEGRAGRTSAAGGAAASAVG